VTFQRDKKKEEEYLKMFWFVPFAKRV